MLMHAMAAVLWACAALLWGASGYLASDKPESAASVISAVTALIVSLMAFTLQVIT